MKKLICIILAVCMAACFAACSGGSADTTTDGAATQGYLFQHNGTQIAMKADAAPILAALGEPVSYTEETSCAFVGLDKTYYFGSFYLQTYPEGDKDFVHGLWFADDSVSTPEGIYIGATQAQVEAAYGTEGYNGSNAYVMPKDGMQLTVILTDGAVSSVQYTAIFE